MALSECSFTAAVLFLWVARFVLARAAQTLRRKTLFGSELMLLLVAISSISLPLKLRLYSLFLPDLHKSRRKNFLSIALRFREVHFETFTPMTTHIS